MPGRLPNRPEAQPSQISDISSALFRRQRFWMKMATYRPLIVLAGIWVVLLAIALLAYDQLMYTVADTEQTATRPSETALYPHQRSSDTASPADPNLPADDGSEADTPADDAPPAAAEAAAVDSAGISSWSLAALVMTCAVGCWFISRQITAPPRPKAAPKKRPGNPRSPVPPVGSSRRTVYPDASKGPKRLAPYNPNQPLVRPPSGSTPAPAVSPSPSSVHGMAASSSDGSSPSDVTVVAEEFQHRLDWPDESLVNTADVRQRRSLSSYL